MQICKDELFKQYMLHCTVIISTTGEKMQVNLFVLNVSNKFVNITFEKQMSVLC